MKKRIVSIVIGALMLAGCASFYTSASSFPSAATLTAACAAGNAKTPPVRDNACDLYNAVATFCVGQVNLPMNAAQACNAAGYQLQGTPAKL